MENTISRISTFQEVLNDRKKEERLLAWRHKWVNLFFNWIIFGLMIAVFVSCVFWGIDIHTDHRAAALTATALADYQAEQRAVEEARLAELKAAQESEEAIIKREATDGAKMIYGIRKFIEKYGYDERDLRTYIRCAIDRVDFGNGINDFHAVVSQEGQFLAYSENNPVLDEYYQVAYTEIQAWHNESTKPWDTSFRFAELTETGIFLTSEFGVDGYARRVKY